MTLDNIVYQETDTVINFMRTLSTFHWRGYTNDFIILVVNSFISIWNVRKNSKNMRDINNIILWPFFSFLSKSYLKFSGKVWIIECLYCKNRWNIRETNILFFFMEIFQNIFDFLIDTHLKSFMCKIWKIFSNP